MMSDAEYEVHVAEKHTLDMHACNTQDMPSYPLSYAKIHDGQMADEELQQRFNSSPLYRKKTFAFGDKSYELIVREDKIVLPEGLQRPAVEWYHGILMHPGETRTELTIGQHFYWKDMRTTIVDVCKKCKQCQFTKRKHRKLAKVPPKDPEVIPWAKLCIDLIGPYTFGKGKNKTILHCLTMIDPATGWFEITTIDDKRADTVANQLEMTWLSRYPWPNEVVMDRGKEFMAEVRTMMLNDYGIVRKPITTRNPQANAMVERCHATLHEMVRTIQCRDKRDLPQALDQWAGVLSAVGFAMRSTVHTTNRATPAQLVFNRDAIHNVRFEADWQYIRQRKQRVILQNNKRENASRVDYTYKVGDEVMIMQDHNRKHGEDRYEGPHRVSRVHDNGTVQLTYDTPKGGVVEQRWNVRNIYPYTA